MGVGARSAWVVVATLMVPVGVSAQDALGGHAHRQVQLEDLRNQRMTLLALVEAMPAEWLNDADHDGQRTFAQQIAHAGVALAVVVHRLFAEGGRSYDAPPDAETREYDEETLVRTVNEAYGAVEAVLVAQSEATRREMMRFSGQEVPVWQIWDELAEHAAWMGGQTVGNFRKHGLAPPSYRYLFPPEGR